MEIERFERHFFHEVYPLHRHARVPEEQDVKARDEDVIGVMAVQERPGDCPNPGLDPGAVDCPRQVAHWLLGTVHGAYAWDSPQKPKTAR